MLHIIVIRTYRIYIKLVICKPEVVLKWTWSTQHWKEISLHSRLYPQMAFHFVLGESGSFIYWNTILVLINFCRVLLNACANDIKADFMHSLPLRIFKCWQVCKTAVKLHCNAKQSLCNLTVPSGGTRLRARQGKSRRSRSTYSSPKDCSASIWKREQMPGQPA